MIAWERDGERKASSTPVRVIRRSMPQKKLSRFVKLVSVAVAHAVNHPKTILLHSYHLMTVHTCELFRNLHRLDAHLNPVTGVSIPPPLHSTPTIDGTSNQGRMRLSFPSSSDRPANRARRVATPRANRLRDRWRQGYFRPA